MFSFEDLRKAVDTRFSYLGDELRGAMHMLVSHFEGEAAKVAGEVEDLTKRGFTVIASDVAKDVGSATTAALGAIGQIIGGPAIPPGTDIVDDQGNVVARTQEAQGDAQQASTAPLEAPVADLPNLKVAQGEDPARDGTGVA